MFFDGFVQKTETMLEEFFVRYENVWLKLQPKSAPSNQKS